MYIYTKGGRGNSSECLANQKLIYISEIYISTNFKFRNSLFQIKILFINLQKNLLNSFQKMYFFKKTNNRIKINSSSKQGH